MKTLKFKSHLIKPILNKTKTTTWRLFDDKNITENDEFIFINSDTSEKFTHAVVESVIEKPFSELTDEDWAGHERFESDDLMYETYTKYYKQPVDENTLVKIIRFHLK